ncbi:MAG: penicillin-binding transpeptidase domain-containing protein [Acidimicrobiales bacterium]
MSRRLSLLASFILVLFVVVAAQSMNIQFFRAKALDASPINPRVFASSTTAPRGEIVAGDGTILARSVPVGGSQNIYKRVYPLGALTAGVVGFSSPSYGTWALEAQYNTVLSAHAQPAQSFAQVLAPTSAADNVNLTLQPSLQRVAQKYMTGLEGAAVVLDPRNGDVLAMYSNPTYNPTPFTSFNYQVAKAAWLKDTKNNSHGFPPLGLVATQQTFPPGSTFKIVTTSAVVVSMPQLMTKVYPKLHFTKLPNTNKTLSNYASELCGGTIPEMLPPSCDTGYALVGLDLGGTNLANAANSYGYNEVPPIDLPGAAASYFPSASSFTYNQPQLAYSAIGQENVRTSTLMNALTAAAVANGGVMMTPHLMNYITGPDGSIVKRYKPTVWKTPLTPSQAAQIVPLMVNVAKYGTAAGVFPANDDVGAKTGTSQVGNGVQNTDDWMIAFAPASHPTIAVAVVVPFQVTSATGASVAGPIMRCLVEGALALQSGQPASGTSSTCPS